MAENENTITLVGRIGQEPQLRTTSKGDVVEFSVGTNERRRNADNSWSDGPTSWFRVAAWGDLAGNAHASFRKGQLVIVRGVLTIREFAVDGGGKSKAAELRATALGHDLRWGTSTFVDGGRRPAAESAPAPRVAAQAEPERTDGPGATPGEPAQRVAAPAGPPADWASGLGAEDVPF